MYNNFNIYSKGTEIKKAKATDIENWYKVKNTSIYCDGKSVNAFTIIDRNRDSIYLQPYLETYDLIGY